MRCVYTIIIKFDKIEYRRSYIVNMVCYIEILFTYFTRFTSNICQIKYIKVISTPSNSYLALCLHKETIPVRY